MSQTRESQLLLQTTSIMKRLKGKLNVWSNSITLQLMIHCVLCIEDNWWWYHCIVVMDDDDEDDNDDNDDDDDDEDDCHDDMIMMISIWLWFF